MVKRTLYIGSPAYLRLHLRQIEIHRVCDSGEEDCVIRPIEDLAMVILDHPQITITHQLMRALHQNKVVLLSCDEKHHPAAMMLPMEGHTLQTKRYRAQIRASEPLKKNLWKQIIIAKVRNQMQVLAAIQRPYIKLKRMLHKVRSGDPDNIEGQAAARYWELFLDGFQRDPDGLPPNNLLNYCYAVVRAMVARAIVSAGLLPSLGIHHRNQYNAFCLADDLMEPFRPFADLLVYDLWMQRAGDAMLELGREVKARLLEVATVDAYYGKRKMPLMAGLPMTAASLAACYEGTKRKLLLPSIALQPR